MLQDIDGCLTRMAPKSVFVVTVDARPKLPRDEFDEDLDSMTADDREKLTAKSYRSWFGSYVTSKITRATVSGGDVGPLFYEVVVERIRQTLATKNGGLRFLQIFNYVYRDGAPMMTIGGMIGTDEDQGALSGFDHKFVRTTMEHLVISVPPLTVREKHWLDSRICKGFTTKKLDFELDEELLENYRTFYKEYPTYMEALL
jgi:hypothetical protein